MAANLRKLLASALTGSDLSDSPLTETALDRIAALAFANDLGGNLWRLKWANDHKCYDRALHLLCKRSQHVARSRDMVRKLCAAVLAEWLLDGCPTCGGRRYIMANGSQAKHQCSVCLGTGLRRYTDAARARALGIDVKAYARWDVHFAAVHQKITAADVAADVQIRARLGRFGPLVADRVLAIKRQTYILRAIEGDGPAQKNTPMPEFAVSSATGA